MRKIVVSEFLLLNGVMEDPQWTEQCGRSYEAEAEAEA